MPFAAPFKDKGGIGDLFYGLAKPRDALMKHLNISDNHEDGHKINYYDVGDVAKGNSLPTQNAQFKKWLGEHAKYSVAVDVPDQKYLWPHWRVKSKGGLEWATLVKGIDVHFCLDDMMGDTHFAIPLKMYENEDEFSAKEFGFKGGKWLEKYRAITNAELRWIYRNKDKSGVQKHIQFWLCNKPCLPPWEHSTEIGDLWLAYKPKSW